MSYRIKNLQALDAEVRRIGLEQVERALTSLSDTSLDEAARIHAVRKRCKKIRALVRLVRPRLGKPSYRRLNRHFRDAARRVSDSRDAVVFVETCDRVCERFAEEIERRGTASIRAALTRRLKAHGEAIAGGARAVILLTEGCPCLVARYGLVILSPETVPAAAMMRTSFTPRPGRLPGSCNSKGACAPDRAAPREVIDRPTRAP